MVCSLWPERQFVSSSALLEFMATRRALFWLVPDVQKRRPRRQTVEQAQTPVSSRLAGPEIRAPGSSEVDPAVKRRRC